MKSIFTFKAALLIVVLLSPGAVAAIIEGNFRGTLKSINTAEDYVHVEGYWENETIGSEVSGSFWYDTDVLPNNFPPEYARYYYDDFSNWLGTSVSIGGKTYTLSDVASGQSDSFHYDETWLGNFDSSMTGTDFWLLDIVGLDKRGFRTKMMDFYFSFTSSEFTLFNGWDLIDNFDWYDVGDPRTTAYFNFSLEINDDMKRSLTWADVDIDEFHLKVRNSATVPEPSSAALFFLGMVALLFRCKKMNGLVK